jgi:hypothetical protein
MQLNKFLLNRLASDIENNTGKPFLIYLTENKEFHEMVFKLIENTHEDNYQNMMQQLSDHVNKNLI